MDKTKDKIPNEKEMKAILRELKKSGAWRGTVDERKQKFIDTHSKLNALYGKNIKLEFIDISAQWDNVSGASGNSAYIPPLNTLFMVRKLSVVTFIQMWLRALGIDPCTASEHSERLFKELFPLSASKLVNVNGILIKVEPQSNDPNSDPIGDGTNGDIPPS